MTHDERIQSVTHAILISGFVVWLSPPVAATEIENVKFVEAYRVGDVKLTLNNVGLMRYKGLIKAMVAGFYVQDRVPPSRALGSVPKRLEIEYFWSLKAKDIVKASSKLLSENVNERELRTLKSQIDQMHSLYENIQPGDRYALTYFPGHGTTLSLNGKFKGTVPGDDFAAAYFSIWLGDQPMDVSLKRQLLNPRR